MTVTPRVLASLRNSCNICFVENGFIRTPSRGGAFPLHRFVFFRRKPADQFFLFFFFGALLLGFVFSENSCQSAFFSGDNLPISLFFGDKLPISLLFFRKTDPHQYVFRENLTLPVGGIPATLCLQETPPHSMAFSCKVLCLRPPPRPSPTRSDLSLGPPLPPSVAYSCNMLVWVPMGVRGVPMEASGEVLMAAITLFRAKSWDSAGRWRWRR